MSTCQHNKYITWLRGWHARIFAPRWPESPIVDVSTRSKYSGIVIAWEGMWYLLCNVDKWKQNQFFNIIFFKNSAPLFTLLSNGVVGSRTRANQYAWHNCLRRVILYEYWLHERITWENCHPKKPMSTTLTKIIG